MRAKILDGFFFRVKANRDLDTGDIVDLNPPCVRPCEDFENGKCVGVVYPYCALDLIKSGEIELVE